MRTISPRRNLMLRMVSTRLPRVAVTSGRTSIAALAPAKDIRTSSASIAIVGPR
jgi:hypothetical protein